MKRKNKPANIKCPYCGKSAVLRKASYVYKEKALDEYLYVCAGYPECDAYVIPIPYFDKNPDGSFREMHYEGDQYPDYVPITKYDEFNFERHHPDTIFIHNPYDDLNLVTSVHPYFFSDKLKKYTWKLRNVYTGNVENGEQTLAGYETRVYEIMG